jgi:hypothetical protein
LVLPSNSNRCGAARTMESRSGCPSLGALPSARMIEALLKVLPA